MTTTISADQVNQIVYNLHHDPFEILGCHLLEKGEKTKKWVVRAYLPKAEAAWVIRRLSRRMFVPLKDFVGAAAATVSQSLEVATAKCRRPPCQATEDSF